MNTFLSLAARVLCLLLSVGVLHAQTTDSVNTSPAAVVNKQQGISNNQRPESFPEYILPIDKKGKRKQYEELQNFITRGIVQKEQSLIQKHSTLLNNNLTSKDYYSAKNASEAAYFLAYNNYTIEKIQEFYQLTGISLLEAEITYDNLIIKSICNAALVVVARIDSMYVDTSYVDNMKASFALTILETLKGDKTLKHVILRDWTGEIIRQGGRRVYEIMLSHGGFRGVQEGQEYLLALDKAAYEMDLGRYNNYSTPDSVVQQRRQACYMRGVYVRLSNDLESERGLPEERKQQLQQERAIKIQTIRSWCTQLAPFFATLEDK